MYIWLSKALMSMQPLHIAAMLHRAWFTVHKKRVHTGDFNHTNYTLK